MIVVVDDFSGKIVILSIVRLTIRGRWFNFLNGIVCVRFIVSVRSVVGF